jgi:hypothetical protein
VSGSAYAQASFLSIADLVDELSEARSPQKEAVFAGVGLRAVDAEEDVSGSRSRVYVARQALTNGTWIRHESPTVRLRLRDPGYSLKAI